MNVAGRQNRWLGLLAGGPAKTAVLVFVALLIVNVIMQPSVLTSSGIMTLADEYTALALAAVGETFVVLNGGLDLSVGSVMSVVNVILAVYLKGSLGSHLDILLIAWAVAVASGLINGIFVAFLNLSSIIVTLATMFIWSGVALLILPQPGGSVPPQLVTGLTGSIGGVVPVALLILVLVGLLSWYLTHTRLGFNIFATGGSEEAAMVAAVPIRWTKLVAFALSGFFYGAAGIFLTAQTGSGDPAIGSGFLLQTFAAVVVGGTMFGGGRGGMVGSIFGAFVLGIITNLLFLFGVSSFATPIFYGLTLFVATVVASPKWRNSLGKRIRERFRQSGPGSIDGQKGA